MRTAMRVTVDIVIFTIQSGALKVLLVKRGAPPFIGQFAIPGGFVHEDEDLDQAALRELREETGSRRRLPGTTLFFWRSEARSSRTSDHGSVLRIDLSRPHAACRHRCAEAEWWAMDQLPPLAFDHGRILNYALERLVTNWSTRRSAFSCSRRNLRSPSYRKFMKQFLEGNWISVTFDESCLC